MKTRHLLFAAFFVAATVAVTAQTTTLPNVTLKTVDGRSVQTTEITNDGKPIILSFWATWCKPCNRELNAISERYDEWREITGVKLVAVSIDDAKSVHKVKPHVDGSGWDFEVYIDANQELKRAMNVVNIPHTFLLDGNGQVLWQHTGYLDGDEEQLYGKIKELIGEK
ncbi:MAG: TlpA family protein disulfide reductase [Bacteroidales bacterium]|nr:TlpA family protein disulfide reductase [Bacteroidales bacterium]